MRSLALAICLAVAACATPRFLHEGDFAALAPGMSQAQVRSALGEPARVENFARLHEMAWDYTFRDHWGYLVVASVIFDESGRFSRTQHVRVEPNDQ